MLTGMTPWYIKAASTFGVPAAIALYLIYYLTASMPTKADMLLIGDELRTHVSSTQTDLTEIRRVLVASCVNSAKNDGERDRCLGR